MPAKRNGNAGRLGITVAVLAGGCLASYWLLAAGTGTSEAPNYASIATTPDGTAALFGAYERAGLRVDRGWDSAAIAHEAPRSTTAFVISPEGWDDALDSAMQDFVRAGGRLVLVAPPWQREGTPPAVVPNALPPPAPPPLEAWAQASLPPGALTVPAATRSAAQPQAALPAGLAPLPLWRPQVSWTLAAGWTPLFAQSGLVYAAERPLGAGMVVLFSEGGFLTNDALSAGGDPALLSWLTGGRNDIYVDESEHGLAHAQGMLWLMHQEGLITALVLFGVLLVLLGWNLAVSLETPMPTLAAAAPTAEANPTGLLQRAIAAPALLRTCWQQFERRWPADAAAVAQLEAGLQTAAESGREEAIVAAYNQLTAARRARRAPAYAPSGGEGNITS